MNWNSVNIILKKNETTQLIPGLVNEVPPKKTTIHIKQHMIWPSVNWWLKSQFFSIPPTQLGFLITVGWPLSGFTRNAYSWKIGSIFQWIFLWSSTEVFRITTSFFVTKSQSLFNRLLRLKTYWWKILLVGFDHDILYQPFYMQKNMKNRKNQIFAVLSVAEIPTTSVLVIASLGSWWILQYVNPCYKYLHSIISIIGNESLELVINYYYMYIEPTILNHI